MEIEQTALWLEASDIITGGDLPVHFEYAAVLHPIADGADYQAIKVLNQDVLRDYEQNYSDITMVRLLVSGGVYAAHVYPFKDNLDITLIKYPLMEGSDIANTAQPIQAERFTATILDTGSPTLQAGGMNAMNETTLDLTNMLEINFQLVSKTVESLRVVEVGGIFRYCKAEDVVKSVLTNESQKIQAQNSQQAIEGVDMVTATNQTQRDHIVIPQGTKLVELPHYVQEKCGGIYSAGLGYYLQDTHWYLYPCFDTTRFDSADHTVTIINIPPDRLPGIERTYRQDGGNLVILATGEVQFRDDSNTQQINLGNGVRFADASKFMTGFVDSGNNKTAASRGDISNEFMSTERQNGVNYAPVSNTPIHANPMKEYSKLARRQGSVISLVWENSNPQLILPGMMARVLYIGNDQIRELRGVMLKTHHYTQMRGQGLTDSRYVSRSMLSIFVTPPQT